MYSIKLQGKNEPLVLKVKSRQLARSVARAAKESDVPCAVTLTSEPRAITFKNI